MVLLPASTSPPPDDPERRRAFAAIFDAHYRAVERAVMLRTRSTGDGEDICSDVFTLALDRIDVLQQLPAPAVRAWLLRSADLIGRGYRRSGGRRHRAYERAAREPMPTPPAPDEVFDTADDETARAVISQRVQSVLAAMRADQRALLEMASVERLKGPEIAARLSITHQGARLRLMRARQAFRDEYVRQFGEAP